jgi:DNA-directed RNA polymerase omega subunit
LEADVFMVVSREVPESQFAYVSVVSRRARQLMSGARPLVDNPKAHKPTRVAEEELSRGMLEFEVPDPAESAEEKDAKRRR